MKEDFTLDHEQMLLEHVKRMKDIRFFVAQELKKLEKVEEDLDRKSLFQTAADLIEGKDLVTVHFDTVGTA